MRYKAAIMNFCFVLCYFLVWLVVTWNQSGGDIFFIFICLGSLFIHVLTIGILFFKKRHKLAQALSGIVMAVIFCFLVYEVIEYKKSKTKTTIEIGRISSGLMKINF